MPKAAAVEIAVRLWYLTYFYIYCNSILYSNKVNHVENKQKRVSVDSPLNLFAAQTLTMLFQHFLSWTGRL